MDWLRISSSHRYGNSHAIWDHTVLPATRQRWHSRLYPSRSWYSIKRPWRDARLSWPSWLVTHWDGIPAQKTVTHPSTNGAERGLTMFMRRTPLTTTPHWVCKFQFVNVPNRIHVFRMILPVQFAWCEQGLIPGEICWCSVISFSTRRCPFFCDFIFISNLLTMLKFLMCRSFNVKSDEQ